MKMRVEKDLLGSMEVPEEAYYGIHSLRASKNFDLSGQMLHPELIRGLADVKNACAKANVKTGALAKRIADAIVAASEKVANGDYNSEFITDSLQGGAGTSANMNSNEVIANVALEILGHPKGAYDIVHPLDHVNLSQSTNDACPTAARVAAIRLIKPAFKSLETLRNALRTKEREFTCVLKVGRTEMQDAVPMTLGQEFSAWAQAIERDLLRLQEIGEKLQNVNIGATAIGTGINTHEEYESFAVKALGEVTGINFVSAVNMVDATQNNDIFVEISGLLKSSATSLHKIAADLRILSSGPRAGFAEVTLPPLQAGSSIMPGKINPTATEAVSQGAFQIMANDLAITLCAMNGQLELNAFWPLLTHNLFYSLELLSKSATLLAEKCINGITANEDICAKHIENSFVFVTALSPYIGYEKASHFAKLAQQEDKTVRQVALESGELSEEALDKILDPIEMTRPGIILLPNDK